MGECVLEARGIVKVYPGGVEALKGVDLTAGRGVTVVMGPNGSGKTTLLSIMTGALRPTRGIVEVCGVDVWGPSWIEARRFIGFAPQDVPFREKLSLYDNLVWYGMVKGLGWMEARSGARRLAGELGLSEHLRKPMAALSGGLRRRASIAAALTGNPRVIVMDEPASGLDPGARRGLWELIRGLARDRVVVVSTHITEGLEDYADMVYIMHEGRVAASGPPRRLIAEYAPLSRITVYGRIKRVDVEGVEVYAEGGGRLVALTKSPEEALPVLVKALASAGGVIERVEVSRPGLAEVYYRVTGVSSGEVAGR